MSVDYDLQRRIDALLTAAGEGDREGVRPAFSPFFGEGAAKAGRLAAELREAAASGDLERAVAAAEEAAQTQPAGLVKRAVKVFVTHEPLAADPLGWGEAMWWTETAICDPFFYRWHKNIDELYASFQEASGETNDPATQAPEGVSFDGAPSIVLCLSSDIPGADAPSFDFDAFARERLGEDLDGGDDLLTTELPTRFVRSRVTAGIPGQERVTYTTTHLVHQPFTYFLRLENAAGGPREVTVRAFLAHATLADDRRAWIELDKFAVNLPQGVTVLGRPDARSSVIKRRGVTAPGAEPLADGAVDQWCDCGWPYSLLLPSGASDDIGTPFTLMVAVTNHQQDREPDHVRTCGSTSYCGALENYPDRRRMGYPFDRPFARPIADTIAASPSMTSTGMTIRCETARPPE